LLNKPEKAKTPPTIIPSKFPAQLGYMPHTFYSTQGLVPGLIMPPLNTTPWIIEHSAHSHTIIALWSIS